MEKLPSTDDIYQEMISSDEGDFSAPDDGSVEDFEENTWADWCGSAFETTFRAFPPEAGVRDQWLCSMTTCFQKRS